MSTRVANPRGAGFSRGIISEVEIREAAVVGPLPARAASRLQCLGDGRCPFIADVVVWSSGAQQPQQARVTAGHIRHELLDSFPVRWWASERCVAQQYSRDDAYITRSGGESAVGAAWISSRNSRRVMASLTAGHGSEEL